MIQNRYLVVHMIGKGGMGEVYLAVDQRLGSAVALKRTSFADDQGLAAAFEREAKILARLRHPVLPKVSDHFAENGEQYLVMEHISGDDLTKRLEVAQKPFPVSWVMFWADQLLDALSYLHSHEPPIIHRDIKPQNLKLTDDNHIVLLDFGLSKDTANKSVVSAPGTSGSVVGYTPHFAPMEQIRGTGTNPRSDIYSLSATLYQLVTDVVPADALTRADAMLNGQPDPLQAISDINPEVSPAVSNVILKGLEVAQDKRFSTAAEMQRSLRAAYAQIQSEMSAETVAFTVDRSGGDVHLTEPPIKTNAPVAPSEMATITTGALSTNPPQVVSEAPSMDATIQMDAPVVDEPIRQADVKTEVFLAADVPAIAATPEPPVAEVPTAAEAPPAFVTEDFSEITSSAAEPEPEPFEPVATAPIISIESEPEPTAATPPTPMAAQAAAASATATPASKAVPAKKGGSKAGLILGGLAVLFILGLAALGGGWYVYKNYSAAADEKPTPTPVATATPSPSATPSPTVEPTPSPESNSNTNANSANTDVTVEPTPSATPGPFSTTKPTPQTAPTKATAKPAGTPGAKATPKQKPSDRTVIEQ